MPELPDVEGFRRYLDDHARGQRVQRIEAPDRGTLRNTTPQGLGRALKGCTFGQPERHGKWLLAHTDGPTVLLHFGMTGYLAWREHGRDREEHDRVVFVCDGGELRVNMMRKFGGVWLASGDDDVAEITGPLGPDALDLGRSDLGELFQGKRGWLKTALMDQSFIAGIGNISADEILWHACLHPETPAGRLDEEQLDELYTAMRGVLTESVDHGRVPTKESWLTSARDPEAGRCPRCGSRVEKAEVAGRSTYWCPRCQPRP